MGKVCISCRLYHELLDVVDALADCLILFSLLSYVVCIVVTRTCMCFCPLLFRIIRAFLIEEQKIVARVVKANKK